MKSVKCLNGLFLKTLSNQKNCLIHFSSCQNNAENDKNNFPYQKKIINEDEVKINRNEIDFRKTVDQMNEYFNQYLNEYYEEEVLNENEQEQKEIDLTNKKLEACIAG